MTPLPLATWEHYLAMLQTGVSRFSAPDLAWQIRILCFDSWFPHLRS